MHAGGDRSRRYRGVCVRSGAQIRMVSLWSEGVVLIATNGEVRGGLAGSEKEKHQLGNGLGMVFESMIEYESILLASS